jgi:hypothetical protein
MTGAVHPTYTRPPHSFRDFNEDGTGGGSILEAANDDTPYYQLWASFIFNCSPLNCTRFIITKERESEHLTELLGRLKWTRIGYMKLSPVLLTSHKNSIPNLMSNIFNGSCEIFFPAKM